MRDDRERIPDTPLPRRAGMSVPQTIARGLWSQNPVTVGILGICSALAVTARVETALVMGVAVACVCAASGFVISLVREFTPRRLRLITWICLIGTFVIVVEQLAKAFLWEISVELGPYVGLIITNCILLGRAEAFASRNRPLLSALDGAANGLGYAGVLAAVAVVRELLGTGRIELTRLAGTAATPVTLKGYVPNDFLLSAAGAFLVLGLLVALFNALRRGRAPHA